MDIAIFIACLGFTGVFYLGLESKTMLPLFIYTGTVVLLFGYAVLIRFLTHF